MHRILLALLALFAGIAAQAAPAEARVRGETEIGAVLGQRAAARAAAAAEAPAELRETARPDPALERVPVLPSQVAGIVTVRLGADRARE